MDDARGNRLPIITRGYRRVAAPSGRGIRSAAAWASIPLLALPGRVLAPPGWQPEYGWILGAGVTCLGAAWLLSRVGARHELAKRMPEAQRARIAPARATTARARKVPRMRWEDRLASARVGVTPPVSVPVGAAGTAPVTAAAPVHHSGPFDRVGRTHGRLGFHAPRRPSATTAWLHLVSGPTPALAARAACSLAAELLDRGGRVLLIDAGRRCVLHARLGGESRWGVGECLARTLPVLGVVQPTRFGGLHLLARGAEPRLLWEALGRLADDARAHYDHVLVALDPDTPREAGMAIMGRLVEGWWAGEELSGRVVTGLSERLGIVFSAMPMGLESEVMLEPGVPPRAARPAAAPQPLDDGPAGVGFPAVESLAPRPLAPALARADDWKETVAAILAGAAPRTEPEPEHETLVIACDDDVRARLKFLMWVRGMAGPAPAREPVWKLAGARA